jgi:hypothetical protein
MLKIPNIVSPIRSWIAKEIRLHPRLYLLFQGAFLCLSVYWFARPPAPGKAVLLLGTVAAIMTMQSTMTDKHRIGWIVIIFVLFVVEFRSIDKDRRDHDAQQEAILKEERESFAKILQQGQTHFDTTIGQDQRNFSVTVNGLKAVIDKSDRQFEATMHRANRIISGVVDDIRTQTGGDSFAYITFTGPEPPYLTVGNVSHPFGPWFWVAITSHGKYPLRNIQATMMDDERRRAVMQEYNKHPEGDWMKAIRTADTEYSFPYLRPQSPEAPGGDVETLGAYDIPSGNSKRLSIAFSSLNGYWNETLHLGLVNGIWHQCLSVMGPTVKQAKKPFIWCDSNWPEGKTLAEKDWVFKKK